MEEWKVSQKVCVLEGRHFPLEDMSIISMSITVITFICLMTASVH